MHTRAALDTRFHIDLGWWEARGRNLRTFLLEMLDDADASEPIGQEPLDYIDPATAEVYRLDPVWVKVLLERASRPDYITKATPLTNAVLRALVENVNQPMTVTELHQRLGRGTPESLLRMMRAARNEYGIVPLAE